jgi:hypothetical protein
VRKKVIMMSGPYFILECGHGSPVVITDNMNLSKTLERWHRGTLYRDCSRCEIVSKTRMGEVDRLTEAEQAKYDEASVRMTGGAIKSDTQTVI